MSCENGRDGVRLHRSWGSILTEAYILENHRVQTCILPLCRVNTWVMISRSCVLPDLGDWLNSGTTVNPDSVGIQTGGRKESC
jgi:hypothetical protein